VSFPLFISFLYPALIIILQGWINLLLILLIVAIISIVYLLYLSSKSRKRLLKTKDLLRVQLEIQDLTFSAISREIHDNVGQILSLAKVQLNLLSQESTHDGKLLSDAKENISNALVDLREIAKSLTNKKLISLGLLSSIQHGARGLNETGEWDVQVMVEGKPMPVTETQHLVIFRAVQYFINRIIGMEGEKKILITIAFLPENWKIIIVHPRKEVEVDQEQEEKYQHEQSLVLRRLSIIKGTFTITEHAESRILIDIPYA
jgi:signal transduction histidine kinase